MPNFSDLEFEKRYKDFLQVQREWLELVTANQVYSELNANGDPSRPVAFTNDKKTFVRAEHLVKEWQRFADLAEEKRAESALAISTYVYSPVPSIIAGPSKVTISRFPCTSSGKLTRENILKRYTQQLKKLEKLPFAAGAILSLKEEMKAFEQQPEGTLYRSRISNYFDTQVTARFDSADDERNLENFRYGSHGLFIYSERMDRNRDIVANTNMTQSYNSPFDLIKPIPCAVLPSANIYLLEDVDRAKAHIKQGSFIENAISQRKRLFNKRCTARMERARTQEQAAAAVKKIEEGRAAMEELNEMDRELLKLKLAADDAEFLTMPQLRERYGNDVEHRIGKTMKQVVNRTKDLNKEI
ncbi:hypothetical protein Q9R34_19220 [Enterobacter sp. BRE11]|nr:hypothetical protein [Enterobacter sp. BRE11]